MSTSGPERRQLHYFADYEGYCDGRPVLWGQLAHSVDVPADGELDAAALVRALRRRAAEAHGLEAGADSPMPGHAVVAGSLEQLQPRVRSH